MQTFSISANEAVLSFWRNRRLITVLVEREVLGRYRGSFLGILWSLFNPLLMLTVYTFVFSVIFQARWNSQSTSKSEFALLLFAGLMMFNIFAECINRAPSIILNNANYVKKVVFPLEILPWVSMGSSLFHMLVSLTVWLLAYVLFFGLPHPTILYFPLVVLPLLLMILGLTWLLASLGVYLRDVSQVIGVATTLLMFLSPVFYPATAWPERVRPLLFLNPLTPAIEQAREVLYWGRSPDFGLLLVEFIAGLVVAWLGFAWFQKTRRGFADVL